MSAQLSLWGSGIYCWHCNADPGLQLDKPQHWNGFFDADTQQRVCWGCRDKHYYLKNKTEHASMYSEIPVVPEEIQKPTIDFPARQLHKVF